MNRPVVGTLSILALLAAGLYFAFNYKDSSGGDDARKSYQGAAARSAIQAHLDLALPKQAEDIHCFVEEVDRTKLVFARFDVSPIEIPSILGQHLRLPAPGDLKPDATLQSAMAALVDPRRSWWQIDPADKSLSCAQRSGQRNVAPATLKWRVQVATTSPPGSATTRVYVALSEEPANP